MTYATEKIKYGRRLATIVRVYLPYCALDFGIGACSAVLGSGTKCFNTLSTCQVPTDFDGSAEQVLTFTSEYIPGLQTGSIPPFPWLMKISTEPSVITPSEGLGVRASCSVALQDAPWTDQGTDPYIGQAHRPVAQPESVGSFFGKLLKRQPYWEGRKIEIHTGYLDQAGKYDIANFKKRTYLIERITGPDAQGNVIIKGRDPLRAADRDRALWPQLSNGALALDIIDSDTVLQLSTGQAAEYVASEYIRLGEEVMKVVGVNTALDRITVLRATLPLFYQAGVIIADDHDAGTTVQNCILYDGTRIDALIYDLLVNAAGIDPAFIDYAAWQVITNQWMASFNFKRLLTEPVGVKELLTGLTEHLALLWWDDRSQLIKLDVLRQGGFGITPAWNDSAHIIANGPALERRSESRLSRVFVWFGMRTPLADAKKAASYRLAQVSADLSQEEEQRYGSARQRIIYSEWLTAEQGGIALEVAGRLLNEYKDTKVKTKVLVDPKDDDIWTGDRFQLTTRQLQDEHGRPISTTFLVLEAEELISESGARYAYTGIEVATGGRVAFITPDNSPAGTLIDAVGTILADDVGDLVDAIAGGVFPDYSAASEAFRNRYLFISQNDGTMLNGDPGYVIG